MTAIQASFEQPARSTGTRRLRLRSPLWRRIGLGVVALATVLLAFTGSPLLSLLPMGVVLACWAVLALPFDRVVPLVAIALLIFNPASSRPQDGYKWGWWLNDVGRVLFTNLPVKLAPADFLVLLLLFRTFLVIRLSDVGTGGFERRPLRPFAQACAFAVGAILLFTVFGLATGGSFSNSLWQVRQLIWMPCIALIASVAATHEGAIARLKRAIILSALVKVVEALAFTFTVVRPKQLTLEYVTTHSDTVLWSTALAILLAEWFERRTRSTRRDLLLLSPPILAAVVFNDRRTVWVIVFANAFFIAAVAHRPIKKQLARILGLTWPLVLAYIVVGLSPGAGNSAVFKPVATVREIILQEDASSSTRDIENYNLIVTLRQRPLVSTGFGHPYVEAVVAFDVTKSGFVNYRYIPHNSFLGLWAFTGLLCPAAYFLPVLVANYYAMNSRRRSRRPATRAAATWSVCAVIAYLVQAWSDIGMQDWTSITIVGIAMGIGAALAREVRNDEAREAEENRDVPSWELLRQQQRQAALAELQATAVPQRS